MSCCSCEDQNDETNKPFEIWQRTMGLQHNTVRITDFSIGKNLVTSWLCFPNLVPPSLSINCSAISYTSSANLTEDADLKLYSQNYFLFQNYKETRPLVPQRTWPVVTSKALV